MTLILTMLCHYATESRVLFDVMVCLGMENVVMLSVVMLNVVMLSVVMLNVVAPLIIPGYKREMILFFLLLFIQFLYFCLLTSYYREKTKGGTTFSIATLSIKTLSITTLSIKTFSIKTLSIMTFSIMTLSIKTFRIMTFSIMTLSINDSINDTQHK
jgi:hypothetical protein